MRLAPNAPPVALILGRAKIYYALLEEQTMNSMPQKPPTLDTAPHDLAHAPEVPHHRFSTFHESGNYAYARGLEVNPTHLPVALEAMRVSGWHLVSLFGNTDSQHVGFIFERRTQDIDTQTLSHALTLALEDRDRARARVDDLLLANNVLVERNRALRRQVEESNNLLEGAQRRIDELARPPRQSYSELESHGPP